MKMHLKTEIETTTTKQHKLHFEGEGAAAHELSQFNELLTCRICQGYMIEPTTVDYCYHTYCRSCILKHLLRDVYCPQCKGSGGKHISEDNLRSDDTMRSLIYKLVPGLYQRECKSLVEFEEQHRELVADAEDILKPQQQEQQQPEFFSPGEPISLSLEYHPAMLKHCGAGDKPPVCYLQCPADLRVVHLKRFLCSKYDIDAENKHVEVEVTYEDEVLPPSFTLMDVGYCYQWKRHAPMAFRYRILVYEPATTTKNDVNNLSKVNQDIELSPAAATKPSGKSVTFADDVPRLLLQHATNKSTRSKATTKLAKTKQRSNQTILPNNKKEQLEDSAPSTFKSLRSNDMRYSDYSGTNPAPLLRVKSEPEPEEQSNICNLNIVVSIPQSAVDYADEGGFELKTANKKSPQSQSHLPKLKIELNSMKAKLLTMPKSAEARLEQTDDALPQHQLDLETYAKNIGLKPIEPAATVAAVAAQDPNASPMSSCSSSTNGSNGTTADASTSHRKRKKKHSKEPKDPNGKRKKLHAEISSQTDGKMKMKITTTHNHKAHKLDLKRSHSLAGGELAALHQQQQQAVATTTSDALNRTLGEEARSINSLMGASNNNNNNNSDKKELKLPASPPLPPSLFKAFKAAPTAPPATTTATTATVAAVKPKPATQQQQQLQPKPAKLPQHNNNNNNSNRKPTLMPHFVVPQTPLRQAPLPAHHMQRYLSTPSSIASAANKQPKRSISLDETQQQQQLLLAKQPRLDYQQQQQQQLNRLNAAKKQQNYNTQMRLYGPDMAKATTTTTTPNSNSSNMPMLCPTLTITPRARNNNNNIHGLTYPYAEQSMPALEIVRLAAAAAGATATASSAATAASAAARLMGPPVALPRQNNKRASLSAAAAQSPPLSMPAMVKSPPLSVALSAQRGNSSSISNNNSNNLNLNNAAYRTSPPALINLRNPFPTKAKAAAAAEAKKPATTATVAVANGGAGQAKTTLREFRPPTVTTTTTTAAATSTTTTATVAKDADILDLSAGRNNNNSNSNTKQAATSSSSSKSNKPSAATTVLNNNNNNSSSSSSSNSLEAALNKIKQNISNNNNNNSNSNNNNNSASTTATVAAAAAAAGDDLQNLHMLSESATAREKISIKYENNKPKNALVRQQNASVRSIPNPSALAFRNQATPTPTAAAAAAAAAIAAKPLTVKADEQQHKSTPTPTTTTSQLSPGNNSNNNNASATSPRAIKKPTTIDQVAANLNIRAEAKAAALSVEPPLTLTPPTATNSATNTTTTTATTKSPELEKTPSNNKASSVTKTDVKATTTAATTKTTTATTTATPTTTAAAASVAVATATLPLPSLPKAATNSVTSTESMSKPPVQIAATDTLASVASSA